MRSRTARAAVFMALVLALSAVGTGGFSSTPSGSDEVVLTDVASSLAPMSLMQAADGAFYATSEYGFFGRGIFSIGPTGSIRTVAQLTAAVHGYYAGPLVQATDGNFYGTTHYGGPGGWGTVYRMTPGGAITVLHTFDNPSDAPTGAMFEGAALIQAADGNLYGTTRGQVFRLTLSGAFTTLASISLPVGRLLQASDGNFYGVGWISGFNGAVFRVTLAGAVSVVHAFTGPDGADPLSCVIQASDGNLYGTTSVGGASDNGTVFRMTLDGVITVLHAFSGVDGAQPLAELVEGGDGYLYGTTWAGGGRGTLFRLTTDGFGFTVLHTFPSNVGESPYSLLKARDGQLYGITPSYGGSVFRVPRGPAARIVIDSPASGQSVSQPFVLSGWGIDQTARFGPGLEFIHVYAYPAAGGPPVFVGNPGYGAPRPDVNAAFGNQFRNSGWGLTVHTLPPGLYYFVAYPYSNPWKAFDYAGPAVAAIDVRAFTGSQPRVVIDTPGNGAILPRSFVMAGWALDLGATSGSGIDAIHVYAYRDPGSGAPPIFLGAATLGGSRPDVGAAFGPQFSTAGWILNASNVPPAPYQIVVYARSTVTGTFAPAVVQVNVP